MTEPPPGWSAPAGAAGPGDQPQMPGYYYGGAPPPPQPGVVPLRPLSVSELLDGSIKVIRRYPRPTLGMSAAIAVAVTLINVVAVLTFGIPTRPRVTDNTVDTGPGFSGTSVAITGVASVLHYLAGLVLTGALIVVVGKAVQGHQAPIGEVWTAVRPRIWALLGLSLLTTLLAVLPVALGIGAAVLLQLGLGDGGLILGIPLGICGFVATVYLYTRLSLASAALILERASVTAALRRSTVLVRGSWWRVFWITLLAGLIASVLGAIIAVPLSLLGLALSGGDNYSASFLALQQVGTGLASVLLAPFSSGVGALLYIDRRMRAEGLDVVLQSTVLRAGPQAGAPG